MVEIAIMVGAVMAAISVGGIALTLLMIASGYIKV